MSAVTLSFDGIYQLALRTVCSTVDTLKTAFCHTQWDSMLFYRRTQTKIVNSNKLLLCGQIVSYQT